MARLPRLYLPGCAQHVIQRGNNRNACFYAAADYQVYLSFLKDSAQKYQVAIHAFVLMTNHVHLLVTPQHEHGVSRMMQALGRQYVQYFNYTYDRTGTLWEGRYKSTVVDVDSYLFCVYRYIELNPVRASIVGHPADYPWSSFQANVMGKAIKLLTPHPLYYGLGETAEARQAVYQSLFNDALAEREIACIRQATNKSWALGSEQFKTLIAEKTGRRIEPRGKGGDRRSLRFRENQ